ncbi:MAG TPA: hypothetical protein VF293_05975 [Candidatus Limnocylindrales bacterium]
MDHRPNRTDQADTPDSSGDFAAALADEGVRGRYGEPWKSLTRHGDSGEVEGEVSDEGAGENSSGSGGIVGHLHNVAEPFADHIVSPVAGAIGTMIDAASAAWALRESVIERRLKRQAREPLLNLYEAYPEAKLASPRELGLRFVPVEEILGTAVAGIAQRGGDFLPLTPFRGENWAARWQRICDANERLQPLPPVDLIKFGGEYWVVDGHNRVAATLYANGVGLDAMVTEMVPLDGRTSERPSSLLTYLSQGAELRAVASGRRPAMEMRQTEQQSVVETADAAEASGDGRPDTHARLVPRDVGEPGGESL